MQKLRVNLVFDNNNRAKGKKRALIQLYIRLDGKKKYFSTGEHVMKSQWDDSRKQVKNHPDQDELNEYLEDLQKKVRSYCRNEFRSGNFVTLDDIQRMLKGFDVEKDNFINFCKEQLDLSIRSKSENENDGIGKSTADNHHLLIVFLESYQKVIPFSSLNSTFVRDFKSFLRKQNNKIHKGKKLSEGYIVNMLGIFRGYCKKAEGAGLLQFNPFAGVKLSAPISQKLELAGNEENMRLSYDEVMSFWACKSKAKRLKRKILIDAFVFNCLCGGIRYSDILAKSGKKDTPDGLRVANVKVNGEKVYVTVTAKKTKKYRITVTFPAHAMFKGLPKKILLPYLKGKKPNDLVFCAYSNMKANLALRAVAEQAEIKKHITWHTSRHTCGTLLKESGLDNQTIQDLIGWKSAETMEKYLHESRDSIVKKIEEHFEE